MQNVLEMKDITKRFPGVLANDRISLDIRPGEVHALVGENGSGKSTLMNILFGLYKPDHGEIWVRGRRVAITDPRTAIDHRIGMVFQHFMLVENLTVAENVILGAEPKQGIFLDYEKAVDKVGQLAEQYGLQIDPQAVVGNISVGQQQRVEIVKALYRSAEILVLDEPTAVLTPQEAQELFRVIGNLKQQGTSVIFITHKIEEVLSVSDRVTVLRRGRKVGTKLTKETNQQELAEMMVGREVLLRVKKTPAEPKKDVLRINGLTVRDQRGFTRVKDLSLNVRQGEIVGIAGVEGNGQLELVEAIAGLRQPTNGQILLGEESLAGKTPLKIKQLGLGYIPEDRHKRGLILEFSIADNLILGRHGEAPFVGRAGIRREKAIEENAQVLVQEFDIRPPVIEQLAGKLSGGNQQKIVAAREFSRRPQLLICSQPTRGLDIGAIEFIHQQIVAQRDRGVAVLLVSAELDEILSLSDRIAVMYDGKLVAEMSAEEATEQKLGYYMLGGQGEYPGEGGVSYEAASSKS